MAAGGRRILLAATVAAEGLQAEVGVESLYYRTAETALNHDNVLGLGKNEELLRAAVNLKQAWSEARFVFRGYGERKWDGQSQTS